MEVDEVVEGSASGTAVRTPVSARLKATPRRRLSTHGKKRKEEKSDVTQRLISSMLYRDIAGVRRLDKDDEGGESNPTK